MSGCFFSCSKTCQKTHYCVEEKNRAPHQNPAGPARKGRILMKLRLIKTVPIAFTAALLLALFSGCGGSSYSNTSASSAAAMARPAGAAQKTAAEDSAEVAMEPSETENGATGGALPPSLNLPDSAGRKIIWTVNMSLETLEFDSAISGLTAALQEAGGYIESSSVNGQSLEGHGGGRRYGSITARVPQGNLDSFLGAVSTVCNVVSTDRQSEDITLQYTDIETRKRSLEVEQERLLELLGEADNVDTIVALESRLSEIRYQLDGYSSSLRTYDSLVDYSTVYMDLREVLRVSEPVPRTLSERMRSGLSETGRDILDGSQDLLVWVVVNLPYLFIWAVIIGILVLILRRASRRHAAARAAFSSRPASAAPQNTAGQKTDPYPVNTHHPNPYQTPTEEKEEKQD